MANEDRGGSPHLPSLSVRLSLMFAALFVFHGASLTYLPVWLQAHGLSPAQIAIATSAPLFLRLIVTPTVGFAADRSEAHRLMLLGLCSTAIVLMLVLMQAPGGLALIVLTALILVAVQSMMPLADTMAMAAVRTDGTVSYGRVRSWGSLTFILASYVAGWVTVTAGPRAVIWLLLAGLVLSLIAYWMLPRRPPRDNDVAGTTPTTARLGASEVLALVKDWRFALFLLATGATQASHAVLYVFGVIEWRTQGLSAGYIGTLWAIAVAAEIVLFWAAREVARVGAVQLLMIGGACAILRWCAMVLDPAPALLVPLQLLHAGSFGATHLGAMQWIATNVPPRMSGTAQALLSTFTAGVAMGAATLTSGPLYAAFGSGAYLAMALLAVAGTTAAILLARSPGQPRITPTAAGTAAQ